jgi:hypothetical protein
MSAVKQSLVQALNSIPHNYVAAHRGERVNGGHLKEKQDKIKTICKVENLHK